MSHGQEDIQKHVKIYVGVFLALMTLTILTVAVSYFHLPVLPAVLIALAIATVKGSLVAGFFMHLVQEKPIVLWILLLAALLVIPLLILPFVP